MTNTGVFGDYLLAVDYAGLAGKWQAYRAALLTSS